MCVSFGASGYEYHTAHGDHQNWIHTNPKHPSKTLEQVRRVLREAWAHKFCSRGSPRLLAVFVGGSPEEEPPPRPPPCRTNGRAGEVL